jgi:hypothetical protein
VSTNGSGSPPERAGMECKKDIFTEGYDADDRKDKAALALDENDQIWTNKPMLEKFLKNTNTHQVYLPIQNSSLDPQGTMLASDLKSQPICRYFYRYRVAVPSMDLHLCLVLAQIGLCHFLKLVYNQSNFRVLICLGI